MVTQPGTIRIEIWWEGLGIREDTRCRKIFAAAADCCVTVEVAQGNAVEIWWEGLGIREDTRCRKIFAAAADCCVTVEVAQGNAVAAIAGKQAVAQSLPDTSCTGLNAAQKMPQVPHESTV